MIKQIGNKSAEKSLAPSRITEKNIRKMWNFIWLDIDWSLQTSDV